MKATKLNGTFSVSKTSTGVIAITIEDVASGIDFVRIEMKPSQFAEAITGLHGRPGKMEIRGLRYVGKKKEVERAQLRLSKKSLSRLRIEAHNKEKLEQYLKKTQQKEGWILNSYLGSQSSVSYQGDGGIILNFSYTRYVKS